MKSAILRTSEEVLGFTTKKNKDWLDENNQEIQELLSKKRSSYQAHLAKPSCPVWRAAFRLIYNILQRKLREIQNEWWTNLAKRTQQYADLGDYRGFYKALKAVYGPSHQVQSPLRSANRQVLFTDKAFILSRWSSNPSLGLTESSRTQHFSASHSNHSKQNWMNYLLWKKLLKP